MSLTSIFVVEEISFSTNFCFPVCRSLFSVTLLSLKIFCLFSNSYLTYEIQDTVNLQTFILVSTSKIFTVKKESQRLFFSVCRGHIVRNDKINFNYEFCTNSPSYTEKSGILLLDKKLKKYGKFHNIYRSGHLDVTTVTYKTLIIYLNRVT